VIRFSFERFGVVALATLALAGCTGGGAPTPITIYVTSEPTAEGAVVATSTPAPTRTGPAATMAPATPGPTAPPTLAPTPEPTAEPTPTPAPKVTYATLASRAWAKVVKSPDTYLGKGYVLWGCITQFDAATGADSFRAQASYKNQEWWYTDGVNAFFNGDEARLADFVADDIVYMKVVSLGSFSYDTQNGGNTTVPLFEVVSIKRKGSC